MEVLLLLHAGVVATWMGVNKFGYVVHLGHPCPTVSFPTQVSSTQRDTEVRSHETTLPSTIIQASSLRLCLATSAWV